MKRRIIAAAAAIATALSLAPTAQALPKRNYGALNPTTIGASCSNPGDSGQTVKIIRTYFDGSAGSWTIANYNDEPLSVTRSVDETKTKTWNVSAGLEFPILELIKITISSSYTDTQTYHVGEKIGPYDVAPGKTAVLRAGWVVSDFEGNYTRCGDDHVWHAEGAPFYATLPAERHVEISTRDNIRFS